MRRAGLQIKYSIDWRKDKNSRSTRAVQLDARRIAPWGRIAERTPCFLQSGNALGSPFVLNGPPSGHCRYCLRPTSREHARFRRREAGRATMSGRAGYTQGRQRRYNEKDLNINVRTERLEHKRASRRARRTPNFGCSEILHK